MITFNILGMILCSFALGCFVECVRARKEGKF